MKYFENFQQPPIPTLPTHYTTVESKYFSTDSLPDPKSKINASIDLPADTRLIVLESSYVIDNILWCFCKIQNPNTKKYTISGMVRQEILAKFTDGTKSYPIAKDFINPSLLFNPDFSALEIDWRIQKSETVFKDLRRGLYCYLYDTGQESSSSDDDLRSLISLSITPSLVSILQNSNKKNSPEYIEELINKFHNFGTAEAFLAPIKGCATLKILVTIPMRFIESDDVEDGPGTFYEDERQSNPFDGIGEDGEETGEESEDSKQENVVKLVFNNQEGLNTFFNQIATVPDKSVISNPAKIIESSLGVLNIAHIISTLRNWKVDSEELTSLGIDKEIENVCAFKTKLNNYIIDNIPLKDASRFLTNFSSVLEECNKFVDHDFKNLLENKIFRKKDPPIIKLIKIGFKYFGDVIKYLKQRKKISENPLFDWFDMNDFGKINWFGELTLMYDKEARTLVAVSLKNNNALLSLARGALEFLQDEHVLNKTTLNYIHVYYTNIKDKENVVEEQNTEPVRAVEYKKPEDKFNLSGFDDNSKKKVSLGTKNISSQKIKTPKNVSKKSKGFYILLDWIKSPDVNVFMLTPAIPFGESLNTTPTEGPEIKISKFLQETHYPEYTEVIPMPINIFNCVTETANLLQDIKDKYDSINLSQSWSVLVEATKNQAKNEGDAFKKWMNGALAVPDNLRILVEGFEISQQAQNDFKKDPWTAINKHAIPALKENNILQILSELVMCFIRQPYMDTAQIQELIEKFNSIKSYMEQMAGSQVCNPFTKIELGKIAGLEIPSLPTYDPNKSILKELENHFAKIIPEIWMKATTELIKTLMASCVAGNAEDGANATDPNLDAADRLADSLSDPPMDSPLKKMLDEILNDEVPPNTGADGGSGIKPAQKLVNDLICTLSIGELCSLLRGGFVPESVYAVMSAIIHKNKQSDKSILKEGALNSRLDIQRFFRLIGSQITLDFCEILNTLPTDPILCGCTPKQREEFIDLVSVSLPPEAADAFLADLNDKSTSDANNALALMNGLLNGETPEQIKKALEDYPSSVCKKDANGNTIPAAVNLTPSESSFRTVLKTTFDSVYESFNNEAKSWNTITYSKTSSVPPLLSLDKITGKIEIKGDSLESKKDSKQNETVVQYTKIPFYVFKDILDNSSYQFMSKQPKKIIDSVVNFANGSDNIDDSLRTLNAKNTNTFPVAASNAPSLNPNENFNSMQNFSKDKFLKGQTAVSNDNIFSFICKIDGEKQEKLDLNLIESSLKEKTAFAEIKLRKFVNSFMQSFFNYLTIASIEAMSESTQNIVQNFMSNPVFSANSQEVKDGFMQALKVSGDIVTTISNVVSGLNLSQDQVPEFINFLRLLDNFTRSTIKNSNDAGYPESFSKALNGEKAIENSLFMADKGISLYVSISSFIRDNTDNLRSLIELMGRQTESSYILNSKDEKISRTAALLKYLDTQAIEFLEVEKLYSIVSNTSLEYPTYEFKFKDNYKQNLLINLQDASDSINISRKSYQIQNFIINKNDNPFYEIEYYSFLPPNIATYISATLGVSSLNPSKKELYDKYMNKIVPISNTRPANFPTYEEMYSLFFNKTIQSVKNSTFFDKLVIAQPSGSVEQTATEFVVLKLPNIPTQKQKLCGIFPHYLDIDDLKEDAVKKKNDSNCMDNMLNQKLANNEPISTDELEKVERSETQDILLEVAHTLAVRMYAHDIILRGIAVFGYYDPQILKDNELFINFIVSSIESELQGKDALYLRTLKDFTFKKYASSATIEVTDSEEQFIINKRFKTFIHEQLKNNVLPKLAKRLHVDTKNSLQKISFKLNPKIYDTFKEMIDLLKMNDLFSEAGPYKLLNINNSNFSLYLGSYNDNINTNANLSFLFEYLFPIKDFIASTFIICSLSTSTRRQVINTFKTTKDNLREIAKIIYSNGQPIQTDPSSMQETENAAEAFNWSTFLLEMLLTAPLKIFKGYAETADMNVAIVSTSYKLIKALAPETPDWSQPIAGATLYIPGFWFLPIGFNFVNALYYAGGFWKDSFFKDGEQSSEDKLKEMFNLMPDCGDVNNPDKLHFNSANFLDKPKYFPISNSPGKLPVLQKPPINLDYAKQDYKSLRNIIEPNKTKVMEGTTNAGLLTQNTTNKR